MAEILLIWSKTLSNQSLNNNKTHVYDYFFLKWNRKWYILMKRGKRQPKKYHNSMIKNNLTKRNFSNNITKLLNRNREKEHFIAVRYIIKIIVLWKNPDKSRCSICGMYTIVIKRKIYSLSSFCFILNGQFRLIFAHNI